MGPELAYRPTCSHLWGDRLAMRDEQNNKTTITHPEEDPTYIYILTTKIDASVCLCAKVDQFLPVRSHFDTKRPVNSVRIATFQCANFGPLLFAFYCPLLFYENKIKNE